MKKKIIIFSSIAIVVVAAIIGSIFGLSSLFSEDKGNDSLISSSQTDANSTEDLENDAESKDETSPSDKTQSSDGTKSESDKKGGDAKITVGSTQGKKGSIVKIPVNIENNPGFTAALLSFKYDKSVVKYIGYEKGNVLSDYEFNDKDGTLKFLCLENGDVDKDGLLFYIKFEVLKASAESNIELTVEDVVNYDEQSVKTAASNGKISSK